MKIEKVSNQLKEVNIDAIRAEAVKEYRSLWVCHEENERNALGFVKYKFYLAQGYLERTRPNANYSDVVFSSDKIMCIRD